MDFFEMSKNPSNDNLNWIFSFQNTSSVQNICFPVKNREKLKNLRFFCEKIKPTPQKINTHFSPRQMKIDFKVMCQMCAHTILFLDNTKEGPGSLCFKPFVNRTPTCGEKLISSQNGTKFTRTNWGSRV